MAHLASAARALVALSLIAGPCAFASEPDLAGMGARSGAMAGTGAADATGYDAVYANPAGLVEPTRRRLTLGYVAGRHQVQLDGAPRDIESTSGVILGAALPLPFGGVLTDRLALGLGFYFPTSVLNRALAPYPDQVRLPLLDARTQVVSATAGLGARITGRVTAGVGVLVLASLTGEVRIITDPAGRVTTVTNEQIVVDYSPIFGARVRATDYLQLGAVVRGAAQAGYDIHITNTLGAALPVELPPLRVAGVAQYDPWQATLEATFAPRPLASITLGLSWKHWSAFPNPTENATDATPTQAPSRFHDTWVPRVAAELGSEWGALRLVGRAGYFFDWSPSPRDQMVLVDADHHVISAGAGCTVRHAYGVVQIDLFAQWHQLAGSPHASGNLVLGGLTVGADL